MSRILNVGSNLVLDLFGSDSRPGTKIIAWTLNDPGTANQAWFILTSGASNQVKLYVIISGRRVYLRIDGANAVATSDEGLATSFIREVVGNTISFRLGESALAVLRNATPGSQVFVETRTTSDFQRWVIQAPRSPHYK